MFLSRSFNIWRKKIESPFPYNNHAIALAFLLFVERYLHHTALLWPVGHSFHESHSVFNLQIDFFSTRLIDFLVQKKCTMLNLTNLHIEHVNIALFP